MIGETNGIGHEFPKIRKRHVRPERSVQAVSTQLVENNKQNILTLHG
jgi:hypothetical protein